MKTKMNFRICVMLAFLVLTTSVIQAQVVDKKEAELKRLETGVNTAKGKVAVLERKTAVADSLITAGTKMISESKSETKTVEAEIKKLDKEFAAEQKPLTKLTTSKDKDEATQARNDLKALNLKYKADSKALTTRLNAATKKATTGDANINKGKAAKAAAKDAMKAAKETLAAAQKKYDTASGAGQTSSKDKKKK
jgi:hypothetical protein